MFDSADCDDPDCVFVDSGGGMGLEFRRVGCGADLDGLERCSDQLAFSRIDAHPDCPKNRDRGFISVLRFDDHHECWREETIAENLRSGCREHDDCRIDPATGEMIYFGCSWPQFWGWDHCVTQRVRMDDAYERGLCE